MLPSMLYPALNPRGHHVVYDVVSLKLATSYSKGCLQGMQGDSIKLFVQRNRHDITEILLKVVLNIINQTVQRMERK